MLRADKVILDAPDQDAALVAAVKALGASSDNIAISPFIGGKFEARLVNADADFEFGFTDDKLAAVVKAYRAPIGSGRPLSAAMVHKKLVDYGVKLPATNEAVDAFVSTVARGGDPTGMTLVRGQAPKGPVDAKLVPLGDWKYPVFPNDAFGTIEQAKDAEHGMTVDGRRLPYEGEIKAKSLSFDKEALCHIDLKVLLVRADVYGLVSLQNMVVDVTPHIFVSGDAMTVKAVVHPRDFRGEPITAERMQTALTGLGVVERAIKRTIDIAAGQAAERREPIADVVICRGVPARHGKDAVFEMLYHDDRPKAGSEDESGRMDYAERGVIRSVKADEPLGRLTPAEPGVAGRDVYGRILPAVPGKPVNLRVGEGVRVSADGTEFTAAVDGMVVHAGASLAVTDVFIVHGDVQLNVGNIKLEKGSVWVKGAIQSGFRVEAPGNVLVGEVIESAFVTAQGSVQCQGGILMGQDGLVKAVGDVSARFAKNARIEAGGDVVIHNEINACTVLAGGRVRATQGSGKVFASTITVGGGVEVNELGSAIGVETKVFLGTPPPALDRMIPRKKKLCAVVQRIITVVGCDHPREILMRTAPEKRAVVAELLKARLKAQQELKDIETQVEMERERLKVGMKAALKVKGTMYPGVVVDVYGVLFKVVEVMRRVRLSYDVESKGILVTHF